MLLWGLPQDFILDGRYSGPLYGDDKWSSCGRKGLGSTLTLFFSLAAHGTGMYHNCRAGPLESVIHTSAPLRSADIRCLRPAETSVSRECRFL